MTLLMYDGERVVPGEASETLPPYNSSATCPKCGHDQIGTRWKAAKPGHPFEHGAPEWLMRHCLRCEFNWDEACISMESQA